MCSHLLHVHDVPIIWTESSNHTQNCGVLTDHFPKGLSEGVDELAHCCDTMTEWPVSNAVHDTMWASRNKQNWLHAHNEWLSKQCAGTHVNAALRRALSALLSLGATEEDGLWEG